MRRFPTKKVVYGHEAYPHTETTEKSGDTMSEDPSDVPGAEGGETVCPICDSTDTETIVDGELNYRCLECGAEFDSSGGRINVE